MPTPSAPIDAKRARRRPSGLLAAAEVLVEGSDVLTRADGRTVRWISGFTWDPEDPTGGTVIAPCDTTAADDAAGEVDDREYHPIIIQSAVECDTWGNVNEEDVAEAERKLRGVEQARLEEELWLGTEAAAESLPNDFLTNTTATILEPQSAPHGYVTALAVLEGHAYSVDDWREPMIHCTHRTATYWFSENLLTRDGSQFFTNLGTRVVVGGGYDGTGPAAAMAAGVEDSDYAFVSDRVRVLLGELRVHGDAPWVMDYSTNLRHVPAERFAAAFFDGSPLAGILIDHTTQISATGS
jgi:hypothetical protein